MEAGTNNVEIGAEPEPEPEAAAAVAAAVVVVVPEAATGPGTAETVEANKAERYTDGDGADDDVMKRDGEDDMGKGEDGITEVLTLRDGEDEEPVMLVVVVPVFCSISLVRFFKASLYSFAR